MVISIKDGFKLFGISIVCFCAVFVCTFFLNFYVDAAALAGAVDAQYAALYDAQMATAKFTCAITGGVLCAIAVVMLVFYIKLFIDGNAKRFGLLKALGYSDARISSSFWVFGLSVLIGTGLGYGAGWAAIPAIYGELTIDGSFAVTPHFHFYLFALLVIAPAALFSLLACGYAYLSLGRNINDMLKGGKTRRAAKKVGQKSRSFLSEMRSSTLRSAKPTVFFLALSCFCFAAMMQMGMSMRDLSSMTMGVMILSIGLVLAVTSMIMAVTTVITKNAENIALMKAFGYTAKERAAAVLTGYIPFAVIGFVVGTVYQYALLKIMCEFVYNDVPGMPEYGFDVSAFFITLAAFLIAYTGTALYYSFKISKISVKRTMSEE